LPEPSLAVASIGMTSAAGANRAAKENADRLSPGTCEACRRRGAARRRRWGRSRSRSRRSGRAWSPSPRSRAPTERRVLAGEKRGGPGGLQAVFERLPEEVLAAHIVRAMVIRPRPGRQVDLLRRGKRDHAEKVQRHRRAPRSSRHPYGRCCRAKMIGAAEQAGHADRFELATTSWGDLAVQENHRPVARSCGSWCSTCSSC
jgi:hypothetical protein